MSKTVTLCHKPSTLIVLHNRAGFTSKLEGMFKDMELSRDINSAFKQHVSHLSGDQDKFVDKIDLTVSVLSMAFWPTYPVMNVLIPPYMLKYQEIFNKFYQVHVKQQYWIPCYHFHARVNIPAASCSGRPASATASSEQTSSRDKRSCKSHSFKVLLCIFVISMVS